MIRADDWDEWEDDDLDIDVGYEPEPRPPTFEQQVAEAARFGVAVTVLPGYYPEVLDSRFTCPRCTRTVQVRARKSDWQLTEALADIGRAHPRSLCEQIRREATAHVQWGLEYGGGDIVQTQESELNAREWAAECARIPADADGYRGPVVVYREVGPWKTAPVPAGGAQ